MDLIHPRYMNDSIKRFGTFCCALAQLSLGNYHTVEQITQAVEKMKKENDWMWNPENRGGGERAIFVIATMPYEKQLADNLAKAGFQKTYSFPRRNGYGEGINDMWMISW